MCCLAEKSFSLDSRPAHSWTGFLTKPKRLHEKVEEYFRNSPHPHGKFQLSKYLAPENKKVVLVIGSGASVYTTAAEFTVLAKQWEEETLYDSSLEAIWFHPAYQRIMAMGQRALPLILKELDKQLGHWFYALANIARDDIARDAVNLEDARQRWLLWGRTNNLI